MAKFCTNCGSEIKPGAKFCENCGQKLEQEQKPQEGAGGIAAAAGAAGAVGAAGAASGADTSYKKSIGDSHDNVESGAKADAAQVNHNTDSQANSYNNFTADNQQKFADERFGSKDDNGSADYNTPPRVGKKFLNLGEGLDLLFKDSSADKEAVFKELFFTSEGRLNRKSYIYRSFFLSVVLCVVQGILTFAAETFGALDLLFSIIAFVLGIFQLAANIMMGVRRLHDLDKCDWWMLLLLVPLVNLFFCLYLLFFKGTEGPNEYGDDPLQQ